VTNCIKKSYPSRAAAEEFAADLKNRYPEQVQQYAYPCEDCPNWHLSSMPPEAYELSKSHPAPAIPPARKDTSTRERVLNLKRQGLSVSEIARQTGIVYQTAYSYCVDAGLHVPRPQPRPASSSIKPAMTVESLSTEERELQAKLEDIKRKKEQLIEAKALKIGPYFGGVRIEKEGNILALSFAEGQDLVEKLIDYLSRHQPAAEGTAA
jgi:hypothetical protein